MFEFLASISDKITFDKVLGFLLLVSLYTICIDLFRSKSFKRINKKKKSEVQSEKFQKLSVGRSGQEIAQIEENINRHQNQIDYLIEKINKLEKEKNTKQSGDIDEFRKSKFLDEYKMSIQQEWQEILREAIEKQQHQFQQQLQDQKITTQQEQEILKEAIEKQQKFFQQQQQQQGLINSQLALQLQEQRNITLDQQTRELTLQNKNSIEQIVQKHQDLYDKQQQIINEYTQISNHLQILEVTVKENNQKFLDLETKQANLEQYYNTSREQDLISINVEINLLKEKIKYLAENNSQQQVILEKVLQQYNDGSVQNKNQKQSIENIQIDLQNIQQQIEQSINTQIETLQEKFRNIEKKIGVEVEESEPEIVQIPKVAEDINSKTIISQLYDHTCKKRQVEPQYQQFVQDIVTESELVEEYGMRSSKCKNVLKSNLSGMRKVRGDGNCFYTAFVFQYLYYQIITASNNEFKDFIALIKTLPFIIQYGELVFTNEDFLELKQSFITQCKQLRTLEKEEQIKMFCQLFQNQDLEFYGLAIVFIRNLAYKCCDTKEIRDIFSAFGFEVKQQLLDWEYDCENNQPVIAELSKYLKLKIIMYFCDSNAKKIQISEYLPTEVPILDVHLLFRPGHYSIGIPKNTL